MSRRSDDTREPGTVAGEDLARCDVESVDGEAVEIVLAATPGDRHVAALSQVFSALGDPTRLRILTALGVRELCVCDLAAVVGVSQSAVSHQLRTLRQLDLVSYRRKGKQAIYRLADDHVRTLLEQGDEHVEERLGDSRE